MLYPGLVAVAFVYSIRASKRVQGLEMLNGGPCDLTEHKVSLATLKRPINTGVNTVVGTRRGLPRCGM